MPPVSAKAREVGRPTRARIGIALGALDLCAVVGAVVVAANVVTGTGAMWNHHAIDVESSRENPIPVGDTVTVGKWTVRVVGVTLNADAVVERENQFNDKPGPGQQYVLVTLDATFNGKGSSAICWTPSPALPFPMTVRSTNLLRR